MILFGLEDSHIQMKHRRISTCPKFKIKFAHFPAELSFVEVGHVLRNRFHKNSAQIFHFLYEVITEELKRTVHDSAVVKGTYAQN